MTLHMLMQLLINVCTYVWDDRDAFIFKSNLIIHQYNSLISKVVSIVIVWLTIRYIPYIHKNGRKNICTQKRLVISRCFFSSKMHSWLLNYSSFFDDIKGKTIYVRTTYHIATFTQGSLASLVLKLHRGNRNWENIYFYLMVLTYMSPS